MAEIVYHIGSKYHKLQVIDWIDAMDGEKGFMSHASLQRRLNDMKWNYLMFYCNVTGATVDSYGQLCTSMNSNNGLYCIT